MFRQHCLRTAGLVAVAVVLGGLAAPRASAEDVSVTVVTRGAGERVSGRLDGVSSDTVFVRVTGADQRRIRLDDVLLIDFVGDGSHLPQTELREARGSAHLVVYRGGASSRGRLVAVDPGDTSESTNDPRTLIFRTENGEEQRVPLTRVGRLYLGNYTAVADSRPSAPVGVSGTTGNSRQVVVPGARQWTRTGIQVRAGDLVRFSATGQLVLSNAAGDLATPAGAQNGRTAPNSPEPSALAGALIGRVGNSRVFGIGDQLGALPMPESGELLLGINDNVVEDNSGEFRVEVFVENRRGERRR